MNQDPNGENPPESQKPNKPNNSGMVVLWLFVGFVPSIMALAAWNKSAPQVALVLLILGIGCCLISGFGISGGIKDSVARFFVGMLLAGVFFLLNVIVVVLIGCTSMGRIAP